ncbi:MAG: CHAT domain-containing protein, partial [Cyanobacteria bacterium J06598_3]
MAAKKILVLAINPKDTVRLRLDEEVRQIKEALKLSEGEAQLEVVSEQAVRASELHRYLLAHKPQIVHFAGHGEGRRG